LSEFDKGGVADVVVKAGVGFIKVIDGEEVDVSSSS